MTKHPANLPDSVYRQYYEKDWITPKQMANLICDNNPDISLPSRDIKFKNTLRRFLYALQKSDLISRDGTCLNNSAFNTQALFIWAINKYPDFREKLPINMIINNGGGHARAVQC